MSTRTDVDADAGEYPPQGSGALPTKDVGRLLLRCADRPGLVAAVSSFLAMRAPTSFRWINTRPNSPAAPSCNARFSTCRG